MSRQIENYMETMNDLHMSKECEMRIMQNIREEKRHQEYSRKEDSYQKYSYKEGVGQEYNQWEYRRQKNNRKNAFLKGKVVFALAAVLVFGGTFSVFGTQIKERFSGLFSKNENISSEVFDSNFYDSDGHVEVHVEEVVSDTMTVRAVVRYTAIDSTGREWLESSLKNEPSKYLYIVPQVKEGESVLAKQMNFANDIRYLGEFSDETDFYFELDYFASDTEEDLKQVRFYYSMPTRIIKDYFGDEYELLDISEAVPMPKYELREYSEDFGEKNYLPTWIKVSKFGLIVGGYSDEAGMTYRYHNQYTSLSMQGMELSELLLVYKNGEIYDLLDENVSEMGQRWMSVRNNDWNEKLQSEINDRIEKMKDSEDDEFEIIHDGTDGEDVFYAISFFEPIRLQEIQGIVIDGCMYELDME